MSEGVEIPITMPGGSQVEALLERIAKNTEKVGDAAKTAEGKSSAFAVSFRGLADAAGAAGAAVVAVTAAVVALVQAAGDGQDHADALTELGGAYDLVRTATNGNVSALTAYRAQVALTTSGLRVSGTELATLTRYAREHKQVTETVTEAVDRMSGALVSGAARGLHQFGISVRSGATQAQTFRAAMQQMTEANAAAAPALNDIGDEADRLQTALTEGVGGLALFASHAIGLTSTVGSLATAINGATQELIELSTREANLPRVQRENAERTQAVERSTRLRGRAEFQALPGGALGGQDISRLSAESINALSDQMEAALERSRPRATASARRAGQAIADAFRGGVSGGAPTTMSDADMGIAAAGVQRARESSRTPAGVAARAARDRASSAEAAEAARENAERGATFGRDIQALRAEASTAITAAAAPPTTARTPRAGATGDGGRLAALQREAQVLLQVQTATDDLRRSEMQSAKERAQAATERAVAYGTEVERQDEVVAAYDRETAARARSAAMTREQTEVENERLTRAASASGQLEAFFGQQKSAALSMADAVKGAYDGMTAAAGDHFAAAVLGNETAGEALQGFVHDTLAAFAKMAAQQALFNLFGGFAALATYRYDAAVQHFAAAAGFAAIAVGAGVAAQATAPASKTKPAGGGDRAASGRELGSGGGSSGGGGETTVVNHYYAPTIGGRESPRWETGQQLGSYTDAARARTMRDRTPAGP